MRPRRDVNQLDPVVSAIDAEVQQSNQRHLFLHFFSPADVQPIPGPYPVSGSDNSSKRTFSATNRGTIGGRGAHIIRRRRDSDNNNKDGRIRDERLDGAVVTLFAMDLWQNPCSLVTKVFHSTSTKTNTRRRGNLWK